MRFKLDENFGTRMHRIFREAGHYLGTVVEQVLSGATDEQLYQVCREQGRWLVCLDLDFANLLGFPPENTGGMVMWSYGRRALRRFLLRLRRIESSQNRHFGTVFDFPGSFG